MAVQFDLSLDELRAYRPDLAEPADFDAFWRDTLAQTRAHDLNLSVTPYDSGLRTVEVFDVRFAGWDGLPVAAWLYLPKDAATPLPTIVQYAGYTGGRGHAHENLFWSAAGYAHLVVDTRGQGTSSSSVGVTGDAASTIGPHAPGFLTMGIESRDSYYYRRVYADAVRAVDAARAHPALDPGRVIVSGMSQGGGLAIAAAGLVDDLVGVISDVPFLCHFRRATEITDTRPYLEIAQYCAAHRDLVDDVFRTLSYFDGVHLAARAQAPALFSVALMDVTCPPSTVFAAYNAYGSGRAGLDHDPVGKDIGVYPYNGHEGGGAFQRADQLAFVHRLLG